MSEKQKLGQEPAFATSADLGGEAIYQEGMSKRFYAACAAMQGLLSNSQNLEIQNTEVVNKAYAIADELLKQENL